MVPSKVLMSLLAALLLVPAPGASAQESSGGSAAALHRTGDSLDPVTAALDVSQDVFAAGEARQVVIGRDDVFADSLAGAVLTGGTGPLLYVPGGREGQLPQAVIDEINRVLPPASACEGSPDVFVLGGTGAVSQAVEEALVAAGRCPERFAGDSRIETATAIATYALAQFPTSQVLVARADDWADAATGGAYAAFSGTPIVVTPTNSLHSAVDAFLASHQVTDIVVLGGQAAISEDVAAQASAHAPVRRIAGSARDATATAIATTLWPRTSAVTAVNGYRADGWVYALAGSAAAAALGAPQVYVQAGQVPPATAAYVEERGPLDLVVGIGPTDVISDAVLESLGSGGPADGGGSPTPPPSDGGGGTIPVGTYVCYQGGTYFFGNVDIVDGSTYDPHDAAPGTYSYDAAANDIQFLTGSYTWMSRGEYHPDGGPDFPGNGPTLLLYFDDGSGEEERIVCGYADD